MFNLLSDEQKMFVRREYKKRFLAVIFGGLGAIMFSASLVLIPSLVLVYNQHKLAKDSLEFLERKTEEVGGNATQEISRIKELAKLVNASQEETAFAPVLEKIVSSKNSSVTLTQFTFIHLKNVKEGAPPYDLRISGVAKTRTGLLDFVKKLEQQEDFWEVNLPVSHLAKERDIVFSLALKMNP
ncbi:MAG: hypothetical protein Q8P52_02335 [bacterium]|nr:hypothetical protein [bacterium]